MNFRDINDKKMDVKAPSRSRCRGISHPERHTQLCRCADVQRLQYRDATNKGRIPFPNGRRQRARRRLGARERHGTSLGPGRKTKALGRQRRRQEIPNAEPQIPDPSDGSPGSRKREQTETRDWEERDFGKNFPKKYI